MNDEIKEILEYIKKWMGLSEIPMIVKLEDYITNLQQDNDNQMKYIADLLVQITNLQQESETLRSDFKNQVEYTNKIAEENESNINRIHELEQEIDSEYIQKEYYKSRCEKASEYIKEHDPSDVGICGNEKKYYYTLYEDSVDNLLNILQNGSDSQ